MVLRPIAPLPKVVPGEGKDMRIGFCAIWLAPYCWVVLRTSNGAQTAASSDAESMKIPSWCTPLGGLGNTGRAIHLVHKRNKKRGRLTPSAYQSAIPRILHFLHADVKIKGRKQACSKLFSSRQQIISDRTSRGGECAGAGFTLYLEGYADGQQHHY